MNRTRLVAPLLIAALAGPAAASDLVHTAKAAETFESLARDFYGDEVFADSLRLYNELLAPTPGPGTVLRIPFADRHEVGAGDTWSALAAEHWGDEGLFAELSELVPDRADGLRTGQILTLPVLIPYRVQAGETLAALSRRAYGHSANALWIARINRISDPRALREDQIVRFPLTFTRPVKDPGAASAPVPPPPPVSTPPPAAPPRYLDAIEFGMRAHAIGDYELALGHLEGLREEILARGNTREKVLLLHELTVLYVAFDRASEACRNYRQLLRLDPSLSWDPELVSPKIIRMTRSC